MPPRFPLLPAAPEKLSFGKNPHVEYLIATKSILTSEYEGSEAGDMILDLFSAMMGKRRVRMEKAVFNMEVRHGIDKATARSVIDSIVGSEGCPIVAQKVYPTGGYSFTSWSPEAEERIHEQAAKQQSKYESKSKTVRNKYDPVDPWIETTTK